MHENPAMSGCKIAKKLKLSARTVNRVMKNFRERLSLDRLPGSGRKKGFVNKILEKKIVTHFSRNPGTSSRSLARKLKCSEFYIRKVRKHFKLRAYRVQKVPHRSGKQQETAQKRARKLYDGPLKKLMLNKMAAVF